MADLDKIPRFTKNKVIKPAKNAAAVKKVRSRFIISGRVFHCCSYFTFLVLHLKQRLLDSKVNKIHQYR